MLPRKTSGSTNGVLPRLNSRLNIITNSHNQTDKGQYCSRLILCVAKRQTAPSSSHHVIKKELTFQERQRTEEERRLKPQKMPCWLKGVLTRTDQRKRPNRGFYARSQQAAHFPTDDDHCSAAAGHCPVLGGREGGGTPKTRSQEQKARQSDTVTGSAARDSSKKRTRPPLLKSGSPEDRTVPSGEPPERKAKTLFGINLGGPMGDITAAGRITTDAPHSTRQKEAV